MVGTRDDTHGKVQLHIDLTCVSSFGFSAFLQSSSSVLWKTAYSRGAQHRRSKGPLVKCWSDGGLLQLNIAV